FFPVTIGRQSAAASLPTLKRPWWTTTTAEWPSQRPPLISTSLVVVVLVVPRSTWLHWPTSTPTAGTSTTLLLLLVASETPSGQRASPPRNGRWRRASRRAMRSVETCWSSVASSP